MKIKSLNINSYKHLQNIDLDFTYPKGHAKAGNPLEKICIIGQSATGKTSVLKLIKDNFSKLDNLQTVKHRYFRDAYKLDFNGKVVYSSIDSTLELMDEMIIKDGKEYINGHENGEINYLLNERLKLIYLSSEIISKDAVNIFNQNPVSLSTELVLAEKLSGLQKKYDIGNYTFQFGQEVNQEMWFSMLYKILEYRKKFNQWASELLNKGVIGDLNKLNKQISKWSETNENPLIPFAASFNPILKKLNLEIDLNNTEYPIPIKSQNKDEIIPVSSLSTGTKGLLLSMFPLFELDTSDAIILIDEPERSLFPDMQIDLITHYQKVAPNAQFIVATHSPFIAAAFEPEERFILYFDENGKVAVRKGESPIGDDPNDLLRNDFNVDYYNEFGKKAYKQYLNLKKKLIQEDEPEKKKELLIELTELGDKYNF